MLYEAVKTQLETLKFNGMLEYFKEMPKVKEDNLQLLQTLLEREAAYRQTRSFMYRLHLAKLPQIKSLDNFITAELPVDTNVLSEAASMKFIADHYNVLVVGGSGSGKTHLALGLSHRALQHNYRIRFYKLTDLARALLLAEAHNYQANFIARLRHFHLLVIDEFGYLPIDPKASALLFELFSNLYESVSILITTHLTFEEWSGLFGNTKTTKAMIDRFTHHCLVLETGNKSWRLKEGKMRKS
jgi:DNA replication protein DnaC